ncbi:hypothetical protein GCM10020255_080370 [Rhodococcus baikonurensis]
MPAHGSDDGLEAYTEPAQLQRDLGIIDTSLRRFGDETIADDRLDRLREAVEVFGFHLSGLDMRQNSEVHESVVAELLAWAGVHPDYASLPEADRVELLSAELTTRRPLTSPDAEFSKLTTKELAIMAAGAKAVRVLGAGAVPNYIISMCTSVSDMLEAAVLLKEVGCSIRASVANPPARSASSRCSRRSRICRAAPTRYWRLWTSRSIAPSSDLAVTVRK